MLYRLMNITREEGFLKFKELDSKINEFISILSLASARFVNVYFRSGGKIQQPKMMSEIIIAQYGNYVIFR